MQPRVSPPVIKKSSQGDIEVQRDGSLEKGSVDLVPPHLNGYPLESAPNVLPVTNHNTISYIENDFYE